MTAEWFCEIEGNQHGPLTAVQLKQLATAGQLKQSDSIWKDGMQKRVPARSVKGLFDGPPAETAVQKRTSTLEKTAPVKNPADDVVETEAADDVVTTEVVEEVVETVEVGRARKVSRTAVVEEEVVETVEGEPRRRRAVVEEEVVETVEEEQERPRRKREREPKEEGPPAEV